MVDINFNFLFSIQILHQYYTDGFCPDFIVTPTKDTLQVLSAYKMIWKQYGSMIYIGMMSDPTASPPNSSPFIIPNTNTRFTFYMQCKNPLFFNFTDLPLDSVSGNVLYLTNENNNVVDSMPYISALASPPIAGGYVSVADYISWVSGILTCPLSPNSATANVQITNYVTNVVVPNPVYNIPPSQDSISIDFSSLAAGRYTVSLTGNTPASIDVYYDPSFAWNNYSGIIDIFYDPTLPSAYQILGAGNAFLSPQYVISFLNRSTIWNYNLLSELPPPLAATPYPTITQGSSSPPVYTFVTDGNVISSEEAIPYSQTPLPLLLTFSGSPPATPVISNVTIPNPTPDMLTGSESLGYSSNIFINF